MKGIIITLIGTSMLVATTTADARPKHKYRGKYRHSYHHHGDRHYYDRAPVSVRRHWARGRVYTWNDRRYHWRDGSWTIVVYR